MKVSVFIACSLDGFIADENESLDWLTSIPMDNDGGYSDFIKDINAILMGRKTFEYVQSLETWPYNIPVYVYSKSQKTKNNRFLERITFTDETPESIIQHLNDLGAKKVYIDGGQVIQTFLSKNLIDEMTVTRTSTLLGKGTPLFLNVQNINGFEIEKCTQINPRMIQTKYIKRQ